jgi:hypothetical protein
MMWARGRVPATGLRHTWLGAAARLLFYDPPSACAVVMGFGGGLDVLGDGDSDGQVDARGVHADFQIARDGTKQLSLHLYDR